MNMTEMSIIQQSNDHTIDALNLLCEAASERDFGTTDAVFKQLASLYGSGETSAFLANISNGSEQCIKKSGVYFVGNDCQLDDHMVIKLKSSINKVADYFECAKPFVIVRLLKEVSLPAHFVRLAPSAGVLSVHAGSFDEQVLIHELTHAAVLTGHHGLDEALAYYSESLLDDSSSLPTPSLTDIQELLELQHIERLSLSDKKAVDNVYLNGAAFIQWLVSKSSPKMVFEYYSQFSYLSALKGIQPSIEAFFNVNLADIKNIDVSNENDNITTAVAILNKAYFSGSLDDISCPIETLNEQVDSLERDQLMALLRGMFASINYFNDDAKAFEPRFAALAQRYIDTQSEVDASSIVVNIMLACVQMRSAASYIEIQEIATHLGNCFSQGLQNFPDDGELALMKAKSLYDTPQSQGGDRELAKTFFIKAQQDTRFGSDIQTLAQKYM